MNTSSRWIAPLLFVAWAGTVLAADSGPADARRVPLLRTPAATLARATISRTNLTQAMEPSRLQVFTHDAGVWKKINASVLTNRDRITVPVLSDRLSLVIDPQTNRQALSTGRIELPFLMAGNQATDELRRYRVELYAEPSPARWEAGGKEYVTDVYVSIMRQGDQASVPLQPPLSITLRGEEATAQPRELTVTRTMESVHARVSFGRNDVEARIDALPFTDDSPLVLPVRKLAAVRVTASPQIILGFGLGTASVTVTKLDLNGSPLSEGPELALQVEARSARLAGASIPAGQSSITIPVRSSGLGADRIRVYAGPREGSAEIVFKAPWTFLAFALAGSGLGGGARFFKKRNRQRNQLGGVLAEGCIAGILGTAAVCAGAALNLLPAAVQETEIFALVISAAVAMVGVAGLSWFRQLVPRLAPARLP